MAAPFYDMSPSVSATTEDGMMTDSSTITGSSTMFDSSSMSDSSTDSDVHTVRTFRGKNMYRTRKTKRPRSETAPQPRCFPEPLEHITLMNCIRNAVVTSYTTSRMLVTHNSAGVPLNAYSTDEASRCGYKVAYTFITTLSRFGKASNMCMGHDAPKLMRPLIDALRVTLPLMSSTLADIASAGSISENCYQTAIDLFAIKCQTQAIHNTEHGLKEPLWVRQQIQECLSSALMFASTRRSQELFSNMLLCILPKLERVLSSAHCPSEMLDIYIEHAKTVLNDTNANKGGGPYWVVRTDSIRIVNARVVKNAAFTLIVYVFYLVAMTTIVHCFWSRGVI